MPTACWPGSRPRPAGSAASRSTSTRPPTATLPTLALGPIELVFIAFILFNFIFPIWGIIDAAVRPDAVWAATGQNKIVWVLVQIFLWTIGAIIYFVAIRPKL